MSPEFRKGQNMAAQIASFNDQTVNMASKNNSPQVNQMDDDAEYGMPLTEDAENMPTM